MAALSPSEAPRRMPCQVTDRIHVYGRVRPPAFPNAPLWITVDSKHTTLTCGGREDAAQATDAVSKRRRSASIHVTHSPSFTFDGVIGDAHGSAASTFLDSTARSCVEDSLLRGTSATVLCFGNKASGKSTTMFGDMTVSGLCQRILIALFTVVDAQPEPLTPVSFSGVTMPAPFSYDVASLGSSNGEEEVRRGCRTRYSVKLSCLELRGETVVDLLAGAAHDVPSNGASASVSPPAALPPSPTPSSSLLSSSPNITMDSRGKVTLRNVSKVTCCSAADAIGLIHRSRRAPSSTASPWSPGHVVVIVDVTCEEGEEASTSHHLMRTAKLYLVDLAAAEQPRHRNEKSQPSRSFTSSSRPTADGAVTSLNSGPEAVAIRHSLTILQQVITAISSSTSVVVDERRSQPPYRQRKLTMLLKGHLGGSCRTFIIAHVRPEEIYKQETLATLQLARQLLCVPESPTSRIVEDPAVRVHQLQRQVAALQTELRLQMELNERAASAASVLAAAAAPLDAPTPKGAKSQKQRFGDDSAMDTRRRVPKSCTGGLSDGGTSLSQKGVGPASECHPLLRHSASSSAMPVSDTLTTYVMNFVAGRIAVLPVSTVLEMNTCFELLRQCVTERDIQLRAALTDLRAAEAATAAAFTALAANNARSAVSERLPGRSISTGGLGRRRLASMRVTASLAKDTPSTEDKRSPSMESALSPLTAPMPTCNSLHTALLREPSPSMQAPTDAQAGKGYGSGPSAAGLSRDETKDTVPLSPFPGMSSFPSTVPTVDATTANVSFVTTAAARSASEGVMCPENESAFAGSNNEAPTLKPFSLSSLQRGRVVSSAPLSRIRPSSALKNMAKTSRQASTAQKVSTPWGQKAAKLLSQYSWIDVNSTAHVRRSQSAVNSTLQASPCESSAFHMYTTQTSEGVRQVQHVQQQEETVASLRQRLREEVTHDGHHNDTALTDECRHHERQLKQHREALLRNFELWYRSRMLGQDSATPVSIPIKKPTEDPKRLSIDTMRRRLRRPVTAGSAGSGDHNVSGLSDATVDGVDCSGAYDGWCGSAPALRPAASLYSTKGAVGEAAARAMSAETFSAAGGRSDAYCST
ncbi:hypothetical protein, conserved [Leishmania tarentolae]|uniref:Kinesin motor domain-containing protein n=1 Tax=Leishmania tarentolae TaxID=5689 RepID=A0A640KIJ2_LEITA|nr:hypothetical protein, conserved [Leishmania tarentolae]